MSGSRWYLLDDGQAMGYHYRLTQYRTIQTCQSRRSLLQSQGPRAKKHHQHQQYEWSQRQRV